ncbi:BTAD domain-containing putative transcriptional regulator [Streptomyces sp. NPDC055210]
MIRFGILGPLALTVDGERVELRSRYQRTLLAALLTRTPHPVSVESLCAALWDGEPPANARAALHVHITRLRRALASRYGEGPLRTVPQGYRIEVDPDALDMCRFDTALREALVAREHSDLEREADLLARARAQWRGPALADVPSAYLQRSVVPTLTERWLHVSERFFEVSIIMGRSDRILPELRAATQEHPYREGFWFQWMLALYRCHRQAEALAAFGDVRRLLNDDLGIDPEDRLSRLHRAILNGADPRTTEYGPHRPDRWLVRRQLPPAVNDFVGRTDVLGQLRAALLPAPARPGPPVVVLSGAPGTGKTATAVRVCHEVARHYPDGQWHVPLCADDGTARATTTVLAGLLRDCGAGDARAGAAALRARLRGRRVLLLFDDAHAAEQVMELVPDAPGCAVVVAAKADMPQLSAACGARAFCLDTLRPEESRELLVRALGRRRAEAEPAALEDLCGLCGHLPLALRIAAVRLATHPAWRVADCVHALRRADRLDWLAAGEGRALAVRAAFDLAYRSLPGPAARLFRLLPLAATPDCAAADLPGLTGLRAGDLEPLLEELVARHLLEAPSPRRYRLDDLLRTYAAERLFQEADTTWERPHGGPQQVVQQEPARAGPPVLPQLSGSGFPYGARAMPGVQ